MALADTQQLRMLERLRNAGEQPVTLAEFELHGYAIERVFEHGRLIGVRLLEMNRSDMPVSRRRWRRTSRLPATALSARASQAQRASRRERRRRSSCCVDSDEAPAAAASGHGLTNDKLASSKAPNPANAGDPSVRSRDCYLRSRPHEPCQMATALQSTSSKTQSPVRPSRRAGSQPPTGGAPLFLWLLSQRSRLACGSSGLSPSAPIAASSWRFPLPESWLPGLLLLAFTSALLPGGFTAPLVSVPGVLALLLVGALGPSAVAGRLAAMIATPIGAAPRRVFLATASRASVGREYPLRRPIAR
jgi:hypothetical protein